MAHYKKKADLVDAFYTGKTEVGSYSGNMSVKDRYVLNHNCEGEEPPWEEAQMMQTQLLYHDWVLIGAKSKHEATALQGLPYNNGAGWSKAVHDSQRLVLSFLGYGDSIWHGNLRRRLLLNHEQGALKDLGDGGLWWGIGGNQLINAIRNVLVRANVDEKMIWASESDTICVGSTFGTQRVAGVRMDRIYEAPGGQVGLKDKHWYIRKEEPERLWWRAAKKPEGLYTAALPDCSFCSLPLSPKEPLCSHCGLRRLFLRRHPNGKFCVDTQNERSAIETEGWYYAGYSNRRGTYENVPYAIIDMSIVGRELYTWEELRPFVIGIQTERGVRKRVTGALWEDIKNGKLAKR